MLVNIQLLRFVAAMLVVFYHTAALVPENNAVVHGIFWLGQSIGFAGVDVFFVISGFIMAYTTMGSGGGREAGGFARRRVARIFSGYWPFFLLALLVFNWARPEHVAESNLMQSFFLWPQPLNRTLLEITWTLSFELYFYLLFTFLIWWFTDRNRLLVCMVVTGSLLALNLYRHFCLNSFGLEHIYLTPFWRQFLLSPFILEFFAGALVAWRLQDKPQGWSFHWLAAGLLMFVAGSAVNQVFYSGAIEQGFHVVPRTLWFGTASVMLVAGLVRLELRSIRTPVQFSLSTGGASYAIYLSHILLLELALKSGLVRWISELHFGLTSVAFTLLTFVIAWSSVIYYRRFEQPLHRRFKRVLRVG